jgi:hypothetical protein
MRERMIDDSTPEPLASSTSAPDATRRTTKYLLLAATVATVLQIPFSMALLAPDRGTWMVATASNAAGTVLFSYFMIRLGFRAARRVGFGTLMLAG